MMEAANEEPERLCDEVSTDQSPVKHVDSYRMMQADKCELKLHDCEFVHLSGVSQYEKTCFLCFLCKG